MGNSDAQPSDESFFHQSRLEQRETEAEEGQAKRTKAFVCETRGRLDFYGQALMSLSPR